MSLEAALSKNNELLEKHNGLLERLLASTAGGAPASTEEKPKTTTKKTETKADDTKGDTVDVAAMYAEISKAAMAWVTETGKGSAEQVARSAYLKSDIWPKFKVESIKGIAENADALTKFKNWLDGKAKTDLLGYGAGIFAKPAEAEGGDAGGEEEL